VSVLQKQEVRAVWSKHFVGAHADLAELQLDDDDPGHAMLARHNPKKWIPLLIFLDSKGKEVARHMGKLNDAQEALRLARYVSGRHYLTTDWKAYRVSGK
jgi:hypothetical protein